MKKDTKISLFFISLLGGGGRGSKLIRTFSLFTHFFIDGFPLTFLVDIKSFLFECASIQVQYEQEAPPCF